MYKPALLLLCVACSSPEAPPPAPVAGGWRVAEVHGEAKSAGAPVPPGVALADGTEIEMGAGRIVLEHPEVGTVRSNARSRVSLKSKSRVALLAGKLWATILPQRAGFEVETSNAVAGVRGTEFFVEHGDGRTRVAVVEGEVEVVDSAKPEKKHRVSARQVVVVAPAVEPVVQQLDADAEKRAFEAPAPVLPAPAALQPAPPPAKRGTAPVQIHRDDPARKALEAETARDKKQLDDEAATTRKKAAEKEAEQKKMRDPMEGGKDEVKDFLK